MVTQPNTILYEYRNNIIIVDEPVTNNISSTLVRKLMAQVRTPCRTRSVAGVLYGAHILVAHTLVAHPYCVLQGAPVRYLIPEGVLQYMESNGLYKR